MLFFLHHPLHLYAIQEKLTYFIVALITMMTTTTTIAVLFLTACLTCTDADSPTSWAHPWTMINAVLSTPPAASVRDTGKIDVFYRGSDNKLKHTYNDGSGWSVEEDLGGELGTGPGSVSITTDTIDVFAGDNDNTVMHKRYTSRKLWSDWESISDNGQIITRPAITYWGNRVDIFARGCKNDLQHTFGNPKNSNNFKQNWETLNGILTSAPAAVSWSVGHIDVFYRGENGQLWQITYDSNNWGNHGSVATTFLDGDILGAPAVTTWGQGKLNVLVRGTDGNMWYLTYNGSWGAWQNTGLAISGPPAAVSSQPNRIDVFVRSPSSNLQTTYYG